LARSPATHSAVTVSRVTELQIIRYRIATYQK
jgi:hypothetical protein